MIKSNRLDFIVPGYTGHIPKKFKEKKDIPIERIKDGHIPGYAGYVNKIKPENIFGETFGKITYDIHQKKENSFETFETMNQITYINQENILEKPVSGVRCLSQTLDIQKDFRKTFKGIENVEKENKDSSKVFISKSIPGYSGHIPRIYSENIFGSTFKVSKERAFKKNKQIECSREKNFQTQKEKIPNIFINPRN